MAGEGREERRTVRVGREKCKRKTELRHSNEWEINEAREERERKRRYGKRERGNRERNVEPLHPHESLQLLS